MMRAAPWLVPWHSASCQHAADGVHLRAKRGVHSGPGSCALLSLQHTATRALRFGRVNRKQQDQAKEQLSRVFICP